MTKNKNKDKSTSKLKGPPPMDNTKEQEEAPAEEAQLKEQEAKAEEASAEEPKPADEAAAEEAKPAEEAGEAQGEEAAGSDDEAAAETEDKGEATAEESKASDDADEEHASDEAAEQTAQDDASEDSEEKSGAEESSDEDAGDEASEESEEEDAGEHGQDEEQEEAAHEEQAPAAARAETSDEDGDLDGYLAYFDYPAELMHAAEMAHKAGYKDFDAYSPFPIHGMDDAIGLGRSWLPWVTFGAGATGFTIANVMQFGMLTFDWPMIIGGKPYAPWPSFVPIMFELTVLIGGVTTALVMLIASGCFRRNRILDPEFTNDRFALWISASDEKFDAASVEAFMESLHPVEIKTVHKETA